MIKNAITKSGNEYLFAIPYTPKTNNPIEAYFNQIKTYMKKNRNVENYEQLENNVKNAIEKVKPENYKNYFQHAYGMNEKIEFISANKVIGWKLYPERKGGVKTTDILEFYDEFIKDKYKNHLVIMDNAVIHKSKIIRETIENSKNELLYSVPYHPETNSIEEYFSQLKHYIKKESPNTYEDIYNTIKEILESKITKEHLTNYLKHSYKIYK